MIIVLVDAIKLDNNYCIQIIINQTPILIEYGSLFLICLVYFSYLEPYPAQYAI